MAIIPQKQLFQWEEVEQLGDLERLSLVLNYLPDEQLMKTLERERGNGRDDYPVRAVWNSIVAGVVFQHQSIESLRRELLRNGQLRNLCGFDPAKGQAAVPPSWAYTRFLKLLFARVEMVNAMFDRLVDELCKLLPDFGKVLAADSKGIRSHARPRRKDSPRKKPDGRRDLDANIGKKTYKGTREDGSKWERVTEWFGYKLHLVVDAIYELPVAFSVTPAAASDITEAPKLLDEIKQSHPQLLERTETWAGDKAYDDTKFITRLWDDEQIKPIIDIRNMWKDGEATKLVSGTRNVVYDHRGTISCVCMATGTQREMAYGGFEKGRNTLKYLCPAQHYGIECPAKGQPPARHSRFGGGTCSVKSCVRIKLDEDRRVFTPMARSSYAWERAYKHRTAAERVNSRLDVSFGFEQHFIRGQKKMALRCGLALIVMLAVAVGRIKEKQEEHMRSLVWAA
ncbi:MAG TPA: transposase [Planctomycetota bacterium]|nr:transposase [Planctomycetota bacterium]